MEQRKSEGRKRICMVAGEKYNRLTFICDTDERNQYRKRLARFKCDCGKEVKADPSYVARGRVKSCGCLKNDARRENAKVMHDVNRMVGKVFGKLTVEKALREINGATVWQCRCECGRDHEATSKTLKGGESTQCVTCASTVRRKAIKDGIERRRVKSKSTDPLQSDPYKNLPAFLR